MTTAAELADRRIQAVQMRRAGAAYSAIAVALEVSVGTAHNDVQTALRESLREETGALRTLESERLDDLYRAVLGRALNGSVPHVLAAIRIQERRARLWGLDAPVEVHLRDEYQAELEALASQIGARA